MGKSTEPRKQLRFETLEKRELLTTFYVDGDTGNDTNPGSVGSPFKTIQAGANAVQAAGSSEAHAVLIRGGLYQEEVDVNFSGSSSFPVTFQALDPVNDPVVISGGDTVAGTWTQHSGNIWYATVSGNANNDRQADTVFVNGVLQENARQHGENDLLDIDDWGVVKKGRLSDNATSFQVDDLGGFANDYWNGGRIVFHTKDFTIVDREIIDFSSNGTITLDSHMGLVTQKQDGGYHIYDTLNALDEAGEWYKDDSTNRLYFHFGDFGPGYNPNTDANLEVEFKRRAHGFDLRGRDHIHIKDIAFRGVSLETDSNTDFNVYEGNEFYAYDRENFGRFFVTGDFNVVRDNEFSNTWKGFMTVGGLRNDVVNNYIHRIGFSPTTRAFVATSAEQLLFSHNTVNTFSRSFMDGYPTQSEIAYNVFENGGTLSWDTGVFDSDGGNGNTSYSIFHHNIFRDTEARGIYEAFYGANNNAVIHHNLFYDFTNTTINRPVASFGGKEFRQAYHNTIIGTEPRGALDARDAIQTRYNNNLQISLDRMEALGVDVRGNVNYTSGDFTNFAGDNYTLHSSSDAIDAGVVIPGINDSYIGAAPDAGAFEFGATPWTAGHNFTTEPNPTFAWEALPGTNLYRNGQFLDGIGDWTIVSGSPDAVDRNSWNLGGSGASLTGTFRTRSVEFTPGESIQRNFTGLDPNTTYTLGTGTRVANRQVDGNQYSAASPGSGASTGTHRGEGYVTGVSSSEWVRYDNFDFGDAGQYNQLDLLHIGNPTGGFALPVDGVGVEVRLDSATGPLLANFDQLISGQEPDRLRASRADFLQTVSGVHSIYVSTTGSNGSNIALGSFRLLNDAPPAGDLLTASVTSFGGERVAAQIGSEDWRPGYEEVTFTTGPGATSAEVTFSNQGRLNAYLDRIYLIQGDATRGGEVIDVTSRATAELSLTATTTSAAPGVVNGSTFDVNETGDHPESWIQLDLGDLTPLHNIKLTAPSSDPDRMSNFRVSVWDADPRSEGVELWNRDYLTDGESLAAGESLLLQSDTYNNEGTTLLREVTGQYIRIELLGATTAGDHRLALSEVRVYGYGETDVALTDGIASQSSTDGGLLASAANDGDSQTISSTLSGTTNSWWQVRFAQAFSIGQIDLVNHNGTNFADLSDFTVSVWDDDPADGGSKLWEKAYFGSGSVGQGETFVIDGSEIGTSTVVNNSGSPNSNTLRLASVHQGRVVRVQLNGTNNAGNGRLSLAEVRVKASDSAPSPKNLAQAGSATQDENFYGDVTGSGFATDANDGIVLPLVNFTTAAASLPTWWQVDLERTAQIDQIVVFNRVDVASRLDDFVASVWDGDPNNGGSQLWSRQYNYSSNEPIYSTLETGPGGALLINGSTTSQTNGGNRLDAIQGARYVRIAQTKTNLLSLAEVQVWSNNADQGDNATVNTNATQYDYDFNSALSPVQSGRTSITPATTGDISWSAPVDAGDSGATPGVTNLDRDFVHSSHQSTLHHQLAAGLWEVTVRMGQVDQEHDNMRVFAEEGWLEVGNTYDVDSAGNVFTVVTGQVVVTDGELDLTFSDQGGIDPNWVANSLSLTRLGDVPAIVDTTLASFDYDLGAENSTVESGYELISPSTYRDIAWSSAVTAGSTASGGALNGDYVTSTSATTLDHVVANGVWDVTITSGSADNAHDNLQVTAEGVVKIADLDTVAGEFVEQTFRVSVSDGLLSLDLADTGGATSVWVLNRLSLSKVSDLPAYAGDYDTNGAVEANDLATWQSQYGTDGAADANLDRLVSGFDFLVWQRNLGAGVVTETSLIDSTTLNGSFEDHSFSMGTASNPANKEVYSVNGSLAQITEWQLIATSGFGGWQQTDANGSSDGTVYAFANAGVTLTVTSNPVTGHTVAEGDEFTLQFDAGNNNGASHQYTANLILGGNTYSLGSAADSTNAASGLSTLSFSYTATAADAGTNPVVEIVMANSGGLSKSYLDNVRLNVSTMAGAPSSSLTATSSSVAAISSVPVTIPLAQPVMIQPVIEGPLYQGPVTQRFTPLAIALANGPGGAEETAELVGESRVIEAVTIERGLSSDDLALLAEARSASEATAAEESSSDGSDANSASDRQAADQTLELAFATL